MSESDTLPRRMVEPCSLFMTLSLKVLFGTHLSLVLSDWRSSSNAEA